MASLSILTVSAPRLVAPAGIWFEAVNITGFDVPGGPGPGKVYDPSFHDISYVWTVEGAPLAPYTAVENMLPVWNDANRAHGKKVVFFFPKPGRYRIRVEARDRSGQSAEATQEILVNDPDQAYPGTNTICVSTDPNETWAGVPAGARVVRALPDLLKALASAPTPPRLLFRRGQIFRGIAFRIDRELLGHIDAWGTGDRPVLSPAPGSRASIFQLWNGTGMRQFTVANIDFRGDWDTTTETGVNPNSPMTWAQSRMPCHYAIWNCHFSGFDHLDIKVRKDLASTVLFGNSVVTNWRNYGFLMRSPKARLGLVGMRITQHVDALHGGGKVGSLSNNHGPVRIPDCGQVYIGATDVFSRSGWSGLSGELADQPCLRLNTNGARGRIFNLDRIVCEGGIHLINIEGSNGNVEEQPGNYLIDKAVLIGTAKTIGPFIAADFGGVTARNVIGILPDTPRRHGNRWQGCLRVNMDKPGPGNAEAPFALYSSTFLNLLSPAHDFGKEWRLEEGAEAFVNATLENNLVHAPGRPKTVDLTTDLPGIRPRFRGIRYNFKDQTGKLAGPVGRGQSFLVPYAAITEDTVARKDTPATDQAYWLGAQTGTRHMLVIKGERTTLQASLGEIAVRFEKTGVSVTNMGKTLWEAGAKWTLRLDRAARIPPMDTRFASPETLPLPYPLDGTKAGQGQTAHDDALGRPRGAGPSQGALEPR